MKRCVIVGAAPGLSVDFLHRSITADDYVVAADGGYAVLQLAGIRPAILVADFDSMTVDTYPLDVEVVNLPIRKDETDTAAAVNLAYDRGCRDFLLLGCLGGRLDHTVANFQVMADLTAKGCRVAIADEQNWVTLWQPGTYTLPPKDNAGFSLLAYDPIVSDLTIRHASYTVEDATITSDCPLGVSNAFLPNQSAEISFSSGRLLVFCCKY